MSINKYCAINELNAIGISRKLTCIRINVLRNITNPKVTNQPQYVGDGLYACGPTTTRWIRPNKLVPVGVWRGMTLACLRIYQNQYGKKD